MKQNKAVKIAAGVVLMLLLCCAAAVLLLLYSPPAQQQAARWTTAWLQNRLQTTVRLGHFELEFPHRLTLRGVFITDLQGDTLIDAGLIEVETDLWRLLRDTLPIHRIVIADTHLRLAQTDSTWNYQFILDAFDDGQPPSGRPPGMYIAAGATPVLLQNTRFEWQNTTSQGYFRLNTDSLEGLLEQVRIDTFQLDFSRLSDQKGRMIYRSGAPRPAVDGVFSTGNIDLQHDRLRIENLHIDADSIRATLATFRAREAGGMQIREASTVFSLIGDQFLLEDLQLQMNESELSGQLSLDIGDTLRYRTERFTGSLKNADLTFFTPHPYFKKNPGEAFDFTLAGSGTLDDLQLQQLDVASKNGITALSARGKLYGLRHPNATGGDITIDRLFTDVRTLKAIAPDLELPAGISPGDQLDLKGRARGNLRRMELQLSPAYQPANRSRPLRADLDATVFNLSAPKQLKWEVRVNSLDAPGPLVEKLLPPGTLPRGFELPANTHLSGHVDGDMNRMAGHLDVRTGAPGSTALLDFTLKNWQSNDLQYEMDIAEAVLDSALFAPFLKDTVLSRYLQIPPSLRVKGALQGSPGNLKGEVVVMLPDSAKLEVAYRDSSGQMTIQLRSGQLSPADLLRPEALEAWGFDSSQRLNVEAEIGYDTMHNLQLQLRAEQLLWAGWRFEQVRASGKQLAGTGAFEGLKLEARFDQQELLPPVPFLSSGLLSAQFDQLVLPDSLRRVWVAQGNLALDSLKMHRDTAVVFPGKLAMQIDFTGQKNELDINSDWLEGALKGNFDNQKLPELLAIWVEHHWTENSNVRAPQPVGNDSFAMHLVLQQPELFVGGLVPGLTTLDTLTVEGFYHSGLAGAQIKCREINWQGHNAQHLEGIVSLDDKAATAVLRSKLQLQFQTKPDAVELGARLENGAVFTRLQLLDTLGEARLALGAQLKKDSIWYLRLDSTQTLQYQNWSVSAGNRIDLPENGLLSVHNFEMRLDSQRLRLDGDMGNRLRAEFHSLDLTLLPRLLNMDSTLLQGKLEGIVRVDSLQTTEPTIRTRLAINGLKLYNEAIGDMEFNVRQTGRDTFQVVASLSGANEIGLRGGFSTKSSMNLTADIQRLRLEAARPFVKSLLSECSGELSGQLTVQGTLKKPDVNSSFQLKEVTIRPLVNNVRYRLEGQQMQLRHNALRFDSLQLNDERNRHAWVSGQVDLGRPDSIRLDLRFSTEDFLFLKTTETDTVSYFGTLMADASGTVQGNLYQPVITVNMKPAAESEVYYKYDGGQRALDESAGIVVFVNPNAPQQVIEEVQEKDTYPFRLDLNLELEEGLPQDEMMTFKVIISPLTRDIMEAKGTGTLHLDVFPNGDIHLNGRLEVTSGTAEYSYNNFFKRKFVLKQGGSLIWTRNPYNPVLDLAAHYVVRTSPLPLLAGQSGNTDTTGTTKQTFWLTASLRGYMDDVELQFKLEYPSESDDGKPLGNSNDPNIIQAVSQVNSNPNAISEQVFSLLVFNTFSGAGLDQARVIDLQAGLNKMIAQQLNAMTSGISWIDIDFDLDDNSSTGQADLDIKLKKSFFNNRVTFKASGETNIDYSGSDRNLGGQFDDISVEYKINTSGTLKATVFSEQSYNDLFLRNINETGAGLIFEKEFVRISDIFKRSAKPAPKPKPAQ